MKETSFDVAIVGGGIVGSYAAYRLAKDGLRVGLFEKGQIAGEQSSRNWGFVRLQGRDPAEIPLMVEGRRLWASLEGEMGLSVDWRQGCNLALAADEARMAQFDACLEVAKEFQVDSRLVTPEEVRKIVPGLDTPNAGGLYTPSDGQAEPEIAAPSIARAAQSLGAQIVTNCVVDRIEVTNGSVSGLHTEFGPVHANAVVLCAGAWSKYMLRTLAVRLPQLWMLGSVARTSAGDREVTKAGVWAGFAFRQRVDGTFNIAGGAQADHNLMIDSLLDGFSFRHMYKNHKRLLKLHFGFPFFDFLTARLSERGLAKALRRHRMLNPQPNFKALDRAVHQLNSGLVNLGTVEIDRRWAGYIDCTPDFVPVIERLDSPAGLVVATGLSGHGFGMGLITARVAADLAANRSTGYDLQAFRLSRFDDDASLVPRNVI